MKKFLYLLFVSAILFTVMPSISQAAAYNGNSIVSIAVKYKGVPYKFGGTTTSGFDCSGYLSYVFKQVGVTLPRTSEEQYKKVGTSVAKKDLQPGDLVFFSNTYKQGISHAGIYVGSNNFISATTSSGVAVASLSNTYWGPKYTGAKRVFNNLEEGEFVDLASSSFAYAAVKDISKKGIIKGYDDGTFRPAESVTRGQAAAIINRVLKNTPASIYSYKDVPTNNPFAKDIAAIKEMGVIKGFSDGTFRPYATMTRAEMATIVKNAFSLPRPIMSSAESNKIYNDVDSSYWAFDAIITMNVIDRTTGFKTASYRTSSKASRADFSAAIYNAMNAN
ncbi:NlpC/P60 family protein [Bacillus sp. 1P06AnD]|uniref:C40 family peptidase n=1 Tax=Bacillus sp. 1P06AnD TaxID=3132208 RepID=UPI0039A3896C